jgi:lipopolysaccharide export system permease protein
MSIIHRYITAAFVRYFSMVLVMVVAIYLSVDFLGRIDNFIEDQVPVAEIAFFFLLKIPLIISQITPVGVLLTVLIIFGLMNKNNEIIALKSSGISVFYLLVPVAAMGALVSVILFMFSEVVVPISVSEANRIAEAGDETPRTVPRENIWIRSGQNIVHVKYYRPEDETYSGMTIYFLDGEFNLVRRIDALSAQYHQGRWELTGCMEQSFSRGAAKGGGSEFKGPPQVRQYDQKQLDLAVSPEDFKRVARESGEMNFIALGRYLQKAESDGYDATRYRVDFHAKTAFPLVCLVMSLMGAAVALGGTTRDGMAVSFAYGIVIAFLYWSVYSFCLSLGYGGMLPAWLAPWCANAMFGLATAVMLLNLE